MRPITDFPDFTEAAEKVARLEARVAEVQAERDELMRTGPKLDTAAAVAALLENPDADLDMEVRDNAEAVASCMRRLKALEAALVEARSHHNSLKARLSKTACVAVEGEQRRRVRAFAEALGAVLQTGYEEYKLRDELRAAGYLPLALRRAGLAGGPMLAVATLRELAKDGLLDADVAERFAAVGEEWSTSLRTE